MKAFVIILIIILAGISFLINKEIKSYRANKKVTNKKYLLTNTILRIVFSILWIIVLPIGVFQWLAGFSDQVHDWKYYHIAYFVTLGFIPVSVICMFVSKWMEIKNNAKAGTYVLLIPIANLILTVIFLYQMFHLASWNRIG